MKIAPKDIDRSVEQPHLYPAILFYGPDEGLARDRSRKALSKLIRDPNDQFSLITIEEHQLKENPSLLMDNMSSLSLLGDVPVIYYRDATDKYTSLINEALKNPACQNHLIVCAGDLTGKSSLRKLFDTHKKAASIPCYHDDIKTLQPYVSDFLKFHHIQADFQALQLLCAQFGKDRAITNSELEKLVTFMGENRHLTIKMVEEITQKNDEKTIDNLCVYIGDGQISLANQLCERLYLEGNEPIVLLRSLQRYFQRLLTVHGYLQENIPIDSAMQRLQPPVFWKYVTSFKQHTQANTPEKLLSILTRIQEAERDLKHGKDALAVLLRCVSALSQLHKKR